MRSTVHTTTAMRVLNRLTYERVQAANVTSIELGDCVTSVRRATAWLLDLQSVSIVESTIILHSSFSLLLLDSCSCSLLVY